GPRGRWNGPSTWTAFGSWSKAVPRWARRVYAAARGPSDLAEVRATDVRVGSQPVGRVGIDHPTRLEDVAALGDVQRLEGVLLDEQDRRPLRVDLLDDREDLLDEDRRQPERRLVEEEQAGPAHERPAHGQHLL